MNIFKKTTLALAISALAGGAMAHIEIGAALRFVLRQRRACRCSAMAAIAIFSRALRSQFGSAAAGAALRGAAGSTGSRGSVMGTENEKEGEV